MVPTDFGGRRGSRDDAEEHPCGGTSAYYRRRSCPCQARLRRDDADEAHRHRSARTRRRWPSQVRLNPLRRRTLMPVDPQASVRISAFKWVPPFAQGHVRDLRARWAQEEAGVTYAVRKLDVTTERPADYFEEQPSCQVPSCLDDTVSGSESGAIVLHVGRKD